MRRCTKCSEIKSTSDFYRDRSKKSGFRSHCKTCCGEYERSRITKGGDRHRDNYYREYYGDRPGKNAEKSARYRARKKKQVCSCCTQEQIREIYKNCPEGYEVDHIHPLSKGGLHCCKNLQHLTAEQNRRKSNKITTLM